MSKSSDQPAWQLTLDAVAHYPRPGTNVPGGPVFSPDSRLLTFLFSEGGDLIRALWALDTETGDRRILARAPGGGTTDENVNPEEALRRERQRVREGGITHYSWAKAADRLLVPINGQLYVTSSAGEPLRLIAAADEPAVDAQLTPDGHRVVFVRARELWMADIESGDARRLTFDATETTSNGLAEFIAQEEMGRSAGFWISPDGSSVAYAQVDEGHVPIYPIVHQGTEEWRVEEHRYPFAGGQNAHVRLGIIPIEGGETRWLNLGTDPDIYLARVDWRPDGRLTAQVETRDQQHLELWSYDATSGDRELILSEHVEPWVNLHNDLRFLTDGSFLWSSERSGFRHVYLYGADGDLLRQLTSGDWPVDHLVHLEEGRRAVYFLSGAGKPTERHLFRVSLDGGDPVDLTPEPGFHGATFAADGSRFVHGFESRTHPPSLEVRFVDDREPISLHAAPRPADVAPGLDPPEIVELENTDGTKLYGALYRPPARTLVRKVLARLPDDQRTVLALLYVAKYSEDEVARALGTSRGVVQQLELRGTLALHGQIPDPVLSQFLRPGLDPVIVSVYGGPHAQTVTDTWGMTVDLRAQYLASQGFLVFKLDNRGSARRGLAFEGAISGRMGTVEVWDQVEGVRWLVARKLADPARVGIYGWSYGGYMTLMTLLTASDVFKAGVAGAPVSDWDGYDTHYTERYMGTPAENPQGYDRGSALTHAARLEGQLLLVHGMIDENVHFRHSARLMAALEAADRPFEPLVFPAERHMPRDEQGRRYLEARVADFFKAHLQLGGASVARPFSQRADVVEGIAEP